MFLCFSFLVLTASGVVITADAITVTGSVKSTCIIIIVAVVAAYDVTSSRVVVAVTVAFTLAATVKIVLCYNCLIGMAEG